MKRIMLSLCLVVIVVSLCFVSVFSLRDLNQKISQKSDEILEELSENPSDFFLLSEKLSSLSSLWYEKRGRLFFLTRQEKIGDLDERFSAISFFINNEKLLSETNTSEIKKALWEIKKLTENIYESELPSLKNIL